MGYSPWSLKELDMTERTPTHSHLYMSTGKTRDLTYVDFAGKVISLHFPMSLTLSVLSFQGASVY